MFLRKHYFKRMYIRGLGPLGVDRSGHGPWRASVTIHTWGGGGHRVWWQDRLCPCSPRGVSRVGVHGLALLTLSHAVLGRESPGKGSPQAEEPCTGSRSEGAAAAAAPAGLRGLPGTGTWWHVLSPPALHVSTRDHVSSRGYSWGRGAGGFSTERRPGRTAVPRAAPCPMPPSWATVCAGRLAPLREDISPPVRGVRPDAVHFRRWK